MLWILAFFLIPNSNATTIQILHTNDLHASLDTAGYPTDTKEERGGWAQLKALMDKLTTDAAKDGIETVRLDAGDFSEGTLNYFPEYGTLVFNAFHELKYDAAVFGNHDWLMGADSLDIAYGKSKFPFPILSANVQIKSGMENLKDTIVPHKQISRGGIKIGVFGLSTSENFYKWIPNVDSKKNDVKILKYTKCNYKLVKKEIALLKEDNDVVIALTHIGVDEDQKLAKKTSGIDLIIGGHSHTILKTATLVKDKDGNEVPIVQTGANGNYVGRILLEVEPGKRPVVKKYELVPVLHDGPKDSDMVKLVDQAEEKVKKLFSDQHIQLDDEVGKSSVPLIPALDGPTVYGHFIVDAMRWKSKTHVAMDIGEFHANASQAPGKVTYRNLMELYPRKFEVEQNEGLYIYQAKIEGWILDLAIRYAANSAKYIEFSGVTFERADPVKWLDIRQNIKDIRISGEKICLACSYEVAMPESLLRGAYGVSKELSLIMRNGKPTTHTIWEAGADYLKHIKTIGPTGTDHCDEVRKGMRRRPPLNSSSNSTLNRTVESQPQN